MKFKPLLLTFSIAPLTLLPLVVSCGQSTSNDNNDNPQNPVVKYTQTTTKKGNLNINQAFNLDLSVIKTRQEACNYLINNKKWVIDYKETLFAGETQFLTSEDQIESIEAIEDNSSAFRIIATIKIKPNSVIDANGNKNTTTTTFIFNNLYYYD